MSTSAGQPDEVPTGPLSVAAPLDVPMRTITTVGTGLWALGLVVTTIAWATDHLPVAAPATCVAGILIGLYVVRWLRRHDS